MKPQYEYQKAYYKRHPERKEVIVRRYQIKRYIIMTRRELHLLMNKLEALNIELQKQKLDDYKPHRIPQQIMALKGQISIKAHAIMVWEQNLMLLGAKTTPNVTL